MNSGKLSKIKKKYIKKSGTPTLGNPALISKNYVFRFKKPTASLAEPRLEVD